MDFLRLKYDVIYQLVCTDIANYILTFIDEEDLYDEHIDFIDDVVYIPKANYNRLYHSKFKYCLHSCKGI